jgi:N-acetyl-gamma-glutamyl-phosphate reductase
VANPGCYATAVQLALLPLVETEFVDHAHLIADGKSGVSGAGRKAEVGLLYAEASDNFKAYAVHGHRHHPEILESLQSLEGMTGRKLGLTFVPHLVPMVRGILATVYARITKETDFQALFEARFKGEPFVDVQPAGSEPETRSVRGSNFCRLAVHRPMDGDTLVVLAVEDNLVKGAAGQAVQNMNLMFGFPETMGIDHVALLP